MTKRSYKSKQTQDAPLLEFDLDDVTFTGDGSVSVLDLSEFARLATSGADADDPAAGAIIADIYLALLGEQEYQRFRGHCRRNKTDGETLLSIIGDLASEESDRPTSRSADSSAGPPIDQGTSKVVSFSRATVHQVEAPILTETLEAEAVPQERRVVSYG